MKVMVKKACNDLLAQPGRTLLVVLALIIGMWGVGSVLVSYVILSHDLNENYRRTSPYHIALSSENFSHLDLAQFRHRAGIESAEFRDLSFQRIEVSPDTWLPLWLFGVDDFEHYQLAHIYPQQGAVEPPSGSLLMERNGMLVSDLNVGSMAHIRVAGKIKNVPVSGIVFDPAQAPATQDAFIYAYTDQKTYSQITGEHADKRLLIRLKQADNKAQVEVAANRIIAWLNQQNIRIDKVDIPVPERHPHQWQLNTLIAFQGGIGLLALLAGAILVAQLIGAILARQTRQIGIFKAIGATRRHILLQYLVMVLIPAIVATVMAVPLAVLFGYLYSGFVAAILNFNILTTTLPVYLYLVLLGCGLLLPVLCALPAVLKGSRIPVKTALSDYGINYGRPRVSGSSTRRWRLPFTMLLALRNVFRRKQRLIITVASIALGVAIFSSGFNVRQSLLNFLQANRASMRYDVQVVLKDAVTRETALAPFADIANISYIDTWNGGRGRLQSKVAATGNGIGIVALPYDTDLVKKDIIAGRWLAHDDELEMVMNQKAAEEFGVTVTVGRDYQINLGQISVAARLVGIAKEFDVSKIYLDKTQYDALVNPEHLVNSILFVADDRSYEQVVQLKQTIEHRLADSDLDVFYVMSQAERAKIIFDHLNIILTLFTLLSSLLLIISVLGMAAATGAAILERAREIGVMRAIGATPKMIYRMFVMEGAVVSLTGILIGLLCSLLLSLLAAKFFGRLILGNHVSLQFAFSHEGLVITLFVTLAFGWLASRIPARKAVAVPTRQALSYE